MIGSGRVDRVVLTALVFLVMSTALETRVSAQVTGRAADSPDPATEAESGPGEIDILKLKQIKADALAEELRFEKALVEASAKQSDTAPRTLEAKDVLWTVAFPDGTAGSVPELSRLRSKFNHEYEPAAKKAWLAAADRAAVLAKFKSLAESRAHRAIDSPMPSSASRSLWISLGLGVLALGGGILMTLHENRDRFRWRARALASRPTLLPLALGLSLAALAPALAADGPAALTLGPDQLKAKLAEVEELNQADLAALRRRQSELRQGRALFWLVPKTPSAKRLATDALKAAEDLQEQFREVRVSSRVTAKLLSEAQRIDAEVKADRVKLAGFVAKYSAAARREGLTNLAVCGTLTAAALAPLSLVRRRRRRTLVEDSRLCPRCLSQDTLKTIGPATVEEGADIRQPKTRLVVCDACEYETRENYVRQNRLCFPTVGIRTSGKTHWLANVYDQIKNKDLNVKSVIRKIASRGDQRFDQLVQELKYELIRPSFTTFTSLPEPLTFHVHDSDPLGRNQTMVNMFDFGGEMSNFTIDGELNPQQFRRRALLCDGFTLFLDPTQVIRSAEGSIDSQIQCLQQFAEELHSMRDISSEKSIDVPIAVCVSKIDLLVSRNPMGTEAIDLVADIRRTMGEPITLELIQRRSQMLARAMPRIFPGWGVERDLRESFGGRFMFFPMSAVGLEEAELGNDTLAERQITPFGMLEPLLWLLHMHGYCVLH